MKKTGLLVFIVVVSFSLSAGAQMRRFAGTRPAAAATQPAGEGKVSEKLSVSEHEMALNGQALKYKATAGYLAVPDENGRDRANFFFVGYEKQGEKIDLAQRPITFVFNGGPGAAAVWLHLGAAGPRRIAMADELGNPPKPPYHLVDNEQTWLDLTDLVFIDPVGTGYSRPAPGEKAEQFYGVREDVASVADFIRLYLTRFERWPSPKFLAGESYGTTRAAALSQYLADHYGVSLNGIVLISVVLDFQTLEASGGNDLPYVLYLPSLAAVASYHKKLPPDLQADLGKTIKEVEQFALNEYMPALARGSALPADQRKAIIDKLARYTSLPASFIDKADLRIDASDFRKLLLEDQRKVVGRYDGRITGFDMDPASSHADYDPSFSGYLGAYTATFNEYVRRDLHFKSDLNYEVLSGRVQPWNFGRSGNGYLDVARDLRSAMIKNPHLRVMFAASYYDLATPFFGTEYTVNRLSLPAALQSNVVQTYYTAGHMLYHELASLRKLHADIKGMMDAALAK